MMAQQRSSGRERYWQSVMRKQQASGMSVSAFCRQNDVSASTFYNWKRKLKQRRLEDEPQDQDKPTSGCSTRDNTRPNNTAVKFVPLELRGPPAPTRASCEVVLPDGCRVIVPTQCDAGWLREILEALKERSC